jgi:phenol 2-monooxygenase
MNVSMHDTLNFAWKLNLITRNIAKPVLLTTYENERQKIAHDLITFDREHAMAFSANDQKALAENFVNNIRFISGVGAEYSQNILNVPERKGRNLSKGLREGVLLSPVRVERYIDANPVDLQLDIPMLGQFRVFFFTADIHKAIAFLSSVCEAATSAKTVMGRASANAEKSYLDSPQPQVPMDEYRQPERYRSVSKIFTYALVTTMPKNDFEISDLPTALENSKWSIYLDNTMKPVSCTQKWIGELDEDEIAIVNVRPDGYIGCIGRFDLTDGDDAVEWLDGYYGGFLNG